jgi:hypothetical protein
MKVAIVIKTLFVYPVKECRDLEIKLRPRPLIGWNIESGGRFWLMDDSVLCKLYWIYADDRHTNHKCEGYIGVTSKELHQRWPNRALENFEADWKRKYETAIARGWR